MKVALSTAFVVLFLSASAVAHSASESLGMPLMREMVGTWRCSYRGDDGASISTETNRIANGYWMASSIEHAARPGHFPAHHHDVMTTYDATHHMWVLVHTGSGGSYGIEKSYAPPNARRQRWVTEYPPEKLDSGYTMIDFTPKQIVRRQYWTENGRPQTSKEVCVRQN